MQLTAYQHLPNFYYGETTMTASLEVTVPNGREIIFMNPQLLGSGAAEAAKNVQMTVSIDSANKWKATIYAWKENAGTDRVAASSETTIKIFAITK